MIPHEELFRIARDELLAQDTSLSAEAIDTVGSPENGLLHSIAAVGEEVAWQQSSRDEATYLDTADGEDLSEWVNDRYNIQRSGATSSIVTLAMDRIDTTAALTVPSGTVVRTDDGTVKVATDDDLFFAGGQASGSIPATSLVAGRDQNAEPGTLETFDGIPPATDMTVTNAARAAGGNDIETDEQLRGRARALFLTAQKATLTAIIEGALSVDQVREAAAFEPLDPQGRPAGGVALFIADETGNSNAALVALVDLAMGAFRAAGVVVDVQGATVVLESITIRAIFAEGQATPANRTLLKRIVVSRVNLLDPNGAATPGEAPAAAILTPELIAAAAILTPGLGIGQGLVEVQIPVASVAPNQGNVIRTTEALVKVV